MEEITDTASSLHNWRQRNGLVQDRPGRPTNSTSHERRKLESLLARSIHEGNYRNLAASAGMNACDLVETVTLKLRSFGLHGLQAAIQIHHDHGIVSWLQYLYSL